jgi:regulator of cell morphogenesis and NO signaling
MSIYQEQSGFASQPIGQIAATLPGASAVFRRHKLDFCCGGGQSLAEAAARRGVAVEVVEDELAALSLQADASQSDTIETADTPALISHIKARYHDTHRRDLPELIGLAHRVEAAHRKHPEVPAGLGDLLAALSQDMEAHQQKEEQILFPLMLAGGAPIIAHPIAKMRAEHDDHGAALVGITTLTHDMTPPADACATWRALCTGLTKFQDDLTTHVHLENNVLFPRFATDLPAVPACGHDTSRVQALLSARTQSATTTGETGNGLPV